MLLLNAIVLGSLALIWSKNGIVNLLFKIGLFTLAVFDLVHYLH